MIKIVIGGCRNFTDYAVLKDYLDTVLQNIRKKDKIIILSGHCRGADMLAERYAEENGFEIRLYSADWGRHGKTAGPIRNREMVMQADYVIAFWDYKSRGTKTLIEFARQQGKPLRIKRI